MTKFSLILLLCFFGISVQAADGNGLSVAPQKKPAQLVKVGADTFVDFQDGRVAGFFQAIGKPTRTSVGLNQTENTCDYQQIMSTCRMEIDFAALQTSVRWVKHPNPEKIGQIVNWLNRSQNNEAKKEPISQEFSFYFWYNTALDSTYQSKFAADRLICDNLDWARDISMTNARIKIESWSTEAMRSTAETKVNENQSISNVYNVVLNKLDANTLQFESFGPAKSQGIIPPHIAEQVTSIAFRKQNGESCQVSFTSSLEKIVKVIGDPNFKQIDTTTLSALRDTSQIKIGNFTYLIRSVLDPNNTNVEFE